MMVKKKLIDVVTVLTEDKLDSNGALRNVAVSDAWKRLRQNIDMGSWKAAETVLQELSDNLHKINMLKSMSAQFTKLKAANPDQMVEESDYIAKETPRDNKNLTLKAASELKAAKEDMVNMSKCLLGVKFKLEKDGDVPDKIDVPRDVMEETKSCYNAVTFICDKFKRGLKDSEHLKKRIENGEKRNKELEKDIDDKEEKINKLASTVETLEKKHSEQKEGKMETFKDQMKVKGLERQVQQKGAELTQLTQEHKELKDKLEAMVNASGSEMEDALNPIPVYKVAEMFADIYTKEWKDMFTFLKDSGKNDKDATGKLLQILQDAFQFSVAVSQQQLQKLANDFVCSNTDLALNKLQLQDSDVKQLHSLRRQTCKMSCEQTKTTFITHLEESAGTTYTLQELSDMMVYIEKCLDVCWFMCLQTPAMSLELTTTSGSNVDKAKYDVSSGKGSKVNYVIWPPLLRQVGGDLLKKGFVCAK